MATILLKKRETTGAPAVGDLTNAASGAEVAINLSDERIYSKSSGGSIVELGTNPSKMSLNGKVSEKVDVRAVGASGTVYVNWNDTGVVYLTATGDADFNIDIRGASGITLNNVLETGDAAGFAVMVTQGASARDQVDILIDGVTAVPYWQGGFTGTPAASGISVFAGEVVKTGNASFTVLESVTNFKK